MNKRKKIISMSVYGNKKMYIRGAEVNAELVPEIYPGWTMRVYCSSEVKCAKLISLGCEIVPMPLSRRHAGMFWRFFAAWDKGTERVIFRDSDSRINVREATAVKAWEESGLAAHCMHDHRHHTGLPISGGMWGVKTGFLPKGLLTIVKQKARRPQRRIMDMRFLRDYVQPLIQDNVLRHSSVLLRWDSVPFPKHPAFVGFVGQQHDKRGNTIWP